MDLLCDAGEKTDRAKVIAWRFPTVRSETPKRTHAARCHTKRFMNTMNRQKYHESNQCFCINPAFLQRESSMEKKTFFVAKDGRQFETEAPCRDYDKLLAKIEELKESVRPKEHNTIDFMNGHGYIQLSSERAETFERAFKDLVGQVSPSWKSMVEENPRGFIGRYLDDSDSPLYGLWSLLTQIDTKWRVWGQPFFANHSGEGQGTCLKILN
jgi:hypothetical protein